MARILLQETINMTVAVTTPAHATIWLLQPLTDEGECAYGLFLNVGGRWFICPDTFATQDAAEVALWAVREGLGR